MSQNFSWGFFFENGEKAIIEFPFGPLHPDNIISDLEGEWMKRAYAHLPNLKPMLEQVEDWGFAFVVVNPPRTGEEIVNMEE